MNDRTTNNKRGLKFPILASKDMEIALKCHIIGLLYNGYAPATVADKLSKIRKEIVASKSFTDLEELQVNLFNSKSGYLIAYYIKEFIDFYQINNKKEIISILKLYKNSAYENRKLPDYLNFIMFHEILNDYFNQQFQDSGTLKYKPLLLWWNLTTILPMRPSAFTRLESDCVYQTKDNRYWIKIPQIKDVKSNRIEKLPIHMEINKVVFEMIISLRNEIYKEFGQRKFLIPKEFTIYIGKQFKSKMVASVEDRLTTKQFAEYVIQFQEEVIKKEYAEFKIETILPIHSRHIAIINLFLQGFNLYTISRIAGHKEIETPSNYYAHAESFVTSNIYVLVNNQISNNISNRISTGLMGNKRKAIDKGKLYSEYEASLLFKKVDYGYCGDNVNFPNDCCNDCRSCRHFIFKPSINDLDEGIEWLQNYSEKLSTRISKIIKEILELNSKITTDEIDAFDSVLKRNAKVLQMLIDHKISVEIKILEGNPNGSITK